MFFLFRCFRTDSFQFQLFESYDCFRTPVRYNGVAYFQVPIFNFSWSGIERLLWYMDDPGVAKFQLLQTFAHICILAHNFTKSNISKKLLTLTVMNHFMKHTKIRSHALQRWCGPVQSLSQSKASNPEWPRKKQQRSLRRSNIRECQQ